MSTLTAKIQLRRDTAANWAINNPILAAGEVAFTSDVFYTSTDQQRFKIGDGVQTWSQLDYVPEGSGGTSYPEHLYLTVVNKTGDNLLASGYKVLRVSDAQGQRLAVDYAQANNDANSTDTIGVVYENINNNQEGKIVTIGELTELNTTGSLQGETWTDGDVIYLSPFVEGQITNVKPTAPNHLVSLGYVVYAHANHGKIYIKIDNGYELQELHNVYAPTPSNNDSIFWSSGTNRYENKSIATVLGYTPISATSTNTLTNKRITARTGTVSSSATPTINTDNVDYYSITALSTAITSMTTNLNGTPTTGQTLWISITDNGTARSITWGASFESSTITLPTTTVISTRLDIAFIWNELTSKWRCVGTA